MGKNKNIDWDAQPLGQVPDTEIAKAVGCTPANVGYARKARGISAFGGNLRRYDLREFAHLFGTMSDRKVAARARVEPAVVARHRRKAGISAARNNWDEQPLGTVPDIVLARRLGVNNKTVAEARWRRKIPKWQEERECPCGTGFIAFHQRQRFCGRKCQQRFWDQINVRGLEDGPARCKVALASFRDRIYKED